MRGRRRQGPVFSALFSTQTLDETMSEELHAQGHTSYGTERERERERELGTTNADDDDETLRRRLKHATTLSFCTQTQTQISQF